MERGDGGRGGGRIGSETLLPFFVYIRTQRERSMHVSMYEMQCTTYH